MGVSPLLLADDCRVVKQCADIRGKGTQWAFSSVVERLAVNQEVVGSNPTAPFDVPGK